MKDLVIIGANDFQNQLILKAKSLGYTTHVFAWETGAVGKENADFFYPISITEKEKILGICKRINPVGVCSIASDLAVITVNYISESLRLPCNKYEYTNIQTNKYAMREALKNNGLYCPKFIKVNSVFNVESIKDFSFPIIVKPTDRSGSRCITKLDSFNGIEEAIENACNVSFEKSAIIEEYIEGDEYSMETISQNGVHHYLATTKKITTGSPNFIEVGHKQPSGLDDNIIENAKLIVFKALDALHIENGAAHSEFMVNKNSNICIIEIGARMGGDCIGSDLVHLSTGFDFIKAVIDVSIGKKISVKTERKDLAEIKFIFDENDIKELQKIEKENPESIVRKSKIDLNLLGKTTDSSTRLGYYICKSQ